MVTEVLDYGEKASNTGLILLNAPGNDGVSSTAMTVSGATILLFTTGRGTPLGFPVPTLKISSNNHLFEKKKNWIDFNAGSLVTGEKSMDELTKELKTELLQIPVIDIKIDGNGSPLMVGMQRTTASLSSCFEGETRKILYPELAI